jgi:release factor glutamine methyltransferase
MIVDIGRLTDLTAARLSGFTETPRLDAQVLLAHTLGQSRSWLLAHPTSEPDRLQCNDLESLVRRLEMGEPLAYVLGHREFFGLDFEVTPDVLIPRPETELLVQKAIDWLNAAPGRRSAADIGTGSGCIAVSIAANVQGVHVVATDISAAALSVAARNAKKLGVLDRIEFVECDILPAHAWPVAAERKFDIACANLPYIPTESLQHLKVHDWEPKLALDGGKDGLDPIRKCLQILPGWMAPVALILFEIEASKGTHALSLAYDVFSESSMHLHQDLAGRDRLLEIQVPGA